VLTSHPDASTPTGSHVPPLSSVAAGEQRSDVGARLTDVHLLAPRLRVEERQLLAAFSARGVEATLADPTHIAVPLASPQSSVTALALDRGLATADAALLAALLAQGGTLVVNRAATARLLADRLAFLRHMIVAEIPVPQTTVAFGERATSRALSELGYPALLLPVSVDASNPPARAHDADAGEALVEHRRMLGHESLVLVQRNVLGTRLRLVVVGAAVVGVEVVRQGSDGALQYEEYQPLSPALATVGERVIGRLGSGVYEIQVVESINGPVVTGAGNLVDFRSLSAAGIDVAGLIADFALAQLAKHDTRVETGLETQHG
jgi:[lysine-biosynthesis-protein LysW]---L-2-aminoadipate ligase